MALLQVQPASGSSLQGSSTNIQGSSPRLQTTTNPQRTVSGSINQTPVNFYTNPTTTQTQTQNTVAEPYVDPYAQWGGQDSYNRLVSGFDTQKGTIYDTANDAASATGKKLNLSILDLVDSLYAGQQAIDNRGINNELARTRGMSDVNTMVGNGIRSGATILANKNAVDSSASEGIARAYGELGQRQASDIGNQFALENTDIGMAQENLEMQERAGVRRIETDKDLAVTGIVSDAQNKLAALDTAMANASLPERIAIDQEKNKIRSQVLAQLSQYDKMLSTKTAAIDPMSQEARMAEATKRNQAGAAPEAQFDYNTEAPVQFQNTGPYASQLPIFTYRNREDQ